MWLYLSFSTPHYWWQRTGLFRCRLNARKKVAGRLCPVSLGLQHDQQAGPATLSSRQRERRRGTHGVGPRGACGCVDARHAIHSGAVTYSLVCCLLVLRLWPYVSPPLSYIHVHTEFSWRPSHCAFWADQSVSPLKLCSGHHTTSAHIGSPSRDLRKMLSKSASVNKMQMFYPFATFCLVT